MIEEIIRILHALESNGAFELVEVLPKGITLLQLRLLDEGDAVDKLIELCNAAKIETVLIKDNWKFRQGVLMSGTMANSRI